MFTIKHLVAAMCLGGSFAAHAVPTLQFNPGSLYAVNAGTTLSVSVQVANLAGDIVSGYDLNVKYDPGLLTNPSIIFGTLLGSVSLFEVLESSTGLDTALGLVDFAAVSLLSDANLLTLQNPNSSIVLATLNFDVLTSGAASLDFVFGPTDDVKCGLAAQCIPSVISGIPEPESVTLILTALLACGATVRAASSRHRTL